MDIPKDYVKNLKRYSIPLLIVFCGMFLLFGISDYSDSEYDDEDEIDTINDKNPNEPANEVPAAAGPIVTEPTALEPIVTESIVESTAPPAPIQPAARSTTKSAAKKQTAPKSTATPTPWQITPIPTATVIPTPWQTIPKPTAKPTKKPTTKKITPRPVPTPIQPTVVQPTNDTKDEGSDNLDRMFAQMSDSQLDRYKIALQGWINACNNLHKGVPGYGSYTLIYFCSNEDNVNKMNEIITKINNQQHERDRNRL